MSGGIALGPLLAGALSLVDWRLAYAVLGIGALVIAAAGARTLAPDTAKPEQRTRPDIPGALALGLALAALLTALTLGRDGWLRTPVALLFLAAIVLTATFVAVEHRSRTPMVDLALLRPWRSWRRRWGRCSRVWQ